MSLGNYSTPKNEKGNESNSYAECRPVGIFGGGAFQIMVSLVNTFERDILTDKDTLFPYAFPACLSGNVFLTASANNTPTQRRLIKAVEATRPCLSLSLTTKANYLL